MKIQVFWDVKLSLKIKTNTEDNFIPGVIRNWMGEI